jgi:hypothetical protein
VWTICGDPRTSVRNFRVFDGEDVDDPESNRYVPDDRRFDLLREHGVTALRGWGICLAA